MSATWREFPHLKAFMSDLLALFRASPDKREGHRRAEPILVQMTHDGDLLTEVLALNIERPGFFARTHYPVPSLQIDSNPYFDLVANCWIPRPDHNTNVTTKALHHHGPLLLSTATAFGPGYEQWQLASPEPVDAAQELFRMTLIEHGFHPQHHVSFVDKYVAHTPMYTSDLSVTYALWTTSAPTTWKDRLKRVPALSEKAHSLRKVGKALGLTRTLDLKMEEYLDFYPVEGGFKGVRDREVVEFRRGPVSDYLPSIFHVIQRLGGPAFAGRIHQIVTEEPKLAPEDRRLALQLTDDLKDGRDIQPRFTEHLHFGFHHSNFTNAQIERALGSQPPSAAAAGAAASASDEGMIR